MLAVSFTFPCSKIALLFQMASCTWLGAGVVLNRSDRVYRDPLHTRSVGTEVSAAAAAVALQAHTPLACCTMETWPFRKAFVAVALASADAIRQTACYWWSCRNAGCSCCYLRKRIFDFCCSPNWLSVNAPSFPRIHQTQPIPMLQMRMGG